MELGTHRTHRAVLKGEALKTCSPDPSPSWQCCLQDTPGTLRPPLRVTVTSHHCIFEARGPCGVAAGQTRPDHRPPRVRQVPNQEQVRGGGFSVVTVFRAGVRRARTWGRAGHSSTGRRWLPETPSHRRRSTGTRAPGRTEPGPRELRGGSALCSGPEQPSRAVDTRGGAGRSFEAGVLSWGARVRPGSSQKSGRS